MKYASSLSRGRSCSPGFARLRQATPVWTLFGFLALWTPHAQAGNDEGILVGSQAALTGGAVTATIADGTAGWYNPAGLAHTRRQSVDLNANVYGVGLYAADPFATIEGGTSEQASTTDWQLIPSALSYTRQVSPTLVAAFSIIIPKTTDYDLRTSATEPGGRQWSLGIDNIANEYDYIVSMAWRLAHNLRVGFSVHGIYLSWEQVIQIARGQPGVAGTPFATYSNHTKLGDYGARVGFGLQWTATPRLDLGVSMQSHTLTGFRSTLMTTSRAGLREGSPSQFELVEQDEFKSVWELSTPFSARLGGAYKLGHAQVLIDGSIYTPLDSSARELDRKLSGNARLGCLFEPSERVAFGVGAFTDLNGATGSATVNYAGVAGGVQLTRNYRLADEGNSVHFLTTLAVRYAYGWGRAKGVEFHNDDQSNFTLTTVPLTAHEMAFNLGGGVSF